METCRSKEELISGLDNLEKIVAMLAPSFVTDFDYPEIIFQLKELGFDKVVELTFGAKMVNREYQKILENSKGFFIASVCPGIVETVKSEFPQYQKNLMKVDSPVIATAKICRKFFPKHKTAFISPCNFKKVEVLRSKYVNYAINYQELKELFEQHNIKNRKREGAIFDKLYNDYTKIYPLAGGLSKTANIRGILKEEETKVIDGIDKVREYLKNPDKNVRFIDVTFCIGGCIGGPCTSKDMTLNQKRKRVLGYMEIAKRERIPEEKKGLVKKAKGIKFTID